MESYPTGSRDSLIVAVTISAIALAIVLLKHRKSLKSGIVDWLDERAIIKLGLMFATFIAIWLATRTIGFMLRGLLDEDFMYSTIMVLDVLAAVLFINLCLTLLKSADIEEITGAAVQSTIIALLIFLPRATSKDATYSWGYYGAGVILVGIAVTLVATVYVMRFFKEKG